MHHVKGVVARGKDQPVELTTINVPDPGPGEALVKVQASGVCHTDLHYREGGINDDFPFLLGHEAAGVVSPWVLNARPGHADGAQLTITGPKPALAAVLLQPGNAKAIIDKTGVKPEGDTGALDTLASVMDTFNPHFNISTP
jgi:NADPH:quinone reductase-like Zn-dependent oxidoreductase